MSLGKAIGIAIGLGIAAAIMGPILVDSVSGITTDIPGDADIIKLAPVLVFLALGSLGIGVIIWALRRRTP